MGNRILEHEKKWVERQNQSFAGTHTSEQRDLFSYLVDSYRD